MMGLENIDGVVYPSVRHAGGLNFAIVPEAFDARFKLHSFSLTTPVYDNGYGLHEYFEHARGTQLSPEGDFIWHTQPHFNARTTWPLSAES
jgi:hypothetical protein